MNRTRTYKHHDKILKKPSIMPKNALQEATEIANFLANPIQYDNYSYERFYKIFQRYVRQATHKEGYTSGPEWLRDAMQVLRSIQTWTDEDVAGYPWRPGMLSFFLSKIDKINLQTFPNIQVNMQEEGRYMGRLGELPRYGKLSHNIDKYYYNYEKCQFWIGYKETYKSQDPRSQLYESYYDHQHDVCFYALTHLYAYPNIPHAKYTMSLPYETIEAMWPMQAEEVLMGISYQLSGQNKDWLIHPHTQQLWAMIKCQWHEHASPYWEWNDYIVDALASWIAYDPDVFTHIPSYLWDTLPVHLLMKHMKDCTLFNINDEVNAYLSVLPELTLQQWTQAKISAEQKEEMVWI